MTTHKIKDVEVLQFIKTMSPGDTVCITNHKGEENTPRDYEWLWFNQICFYRAFESRKQYTIVMPDWFGHYKGDKKSMLKKVLTEELESVQRSTASIIEDLDNGKIGLIW